MVEEDLQLNKDLEEDLQSEILIEDGSDMNFV